MEYIIDGILEQNHVHLLAGPSGSGKTTLLFNLIKDWTSGVPIFGHLTHPLPYLYVSMDRQEDFVEERIKAAGIDPSTVPHMTYFEPGASIQKLLKIVPDGTKVLFIDGLIKLCPGGKMNDYQVVSDFLILLQTVAKGFGMTIIGCVHATKVKEGESFLHARHRVIGSVAWGGFSDTLIFIDEVTPGSNDGKRRVNILPRNSRPEEHFYVIGDDGRMINTTPSSALSGDKDLSQSIILLYQALPFDEEMSTATIITLAEQVGLKSRSYINRLVEDLITDKAILRVDRGRYLKKSSRDLNDGKGRGHSEKS